MSNKNVIQVIVNRSCGGPSYFELTLVKTVTRQDGVSVSMIEARSHGNKKLYYTLYHIEDWKTLAIALVKKLETHERQLYKYEQARKLFKQYVKSKTNFSCTI